MKSIVCILLLMSATEGFASYSIHFIQPIEDRKEISCKEIKINHGRLNGSNWNYTINSEKEYKNLIGEGSQIDFTKYTLLGIVSSSGGCKSPTVNHNVFYSNSDNLFQFELTVQENGGCENVFHFEIWCLISKMNSSSRIEFIKKP